MQDFFSKIVRARIVADPNKSDVSLSHTQALLASIFTFTAPDVSDPEAHGRAWLLGARTA